MSIITIQTESSEANAVLKSLLTKIEGLKVISETEEEIVGYDSNRNPILANEYREEIKDRISKINLQKNKGYSSAEVRAKILKK